MNEETLFREALAKSIGERAAFLDAACSGQPELRGAVVALLAAHDASGDVLDNPPDNFDQTIDSSLRRDVPVVTSALRPKPDQAERPSAVTGDYRPVVDVGAVVAGRYKLVEMIGQGGMGEVWVAKQTEPVKRRVAIKFIKAGMDSRAVLARFEQERQALAVMDHPNIARVLDGGLMPTGHPFFVMELVNGLPLTEFCDASRLTTVQRLELFVQICQAVQHAHHKGIVHRDLKPSNILVTLVDGRPVPKVIDFGVAKATSGKLTDESLSTGFGVVVGTLEYMSPEQAGFSNDDIDTRADIYSLGVILYELLSGLRPIDATRLKQAALTEVIRIVREEEPSRPSTRLLTDESLPSLAALRQIEPRRLMAVLRGDLDWVVMKCLEKQRDRRYETANALARDLQRYLAGAPVEACPPKLSYRLSKFVKRHKGRVVAASLVLLALVGGVIGTSFGLLKANQATAKERTAKIAAQSARTAAEKARDRTRDVLDAMVSEVTGDSLTTQKTISPEQKKFLESVLGYYREFAGENPDDERSRARHAQAANRVGVIESRLGRREESVAANQLALESYASLASDFPTVSNYRQSLATSYLNLANQLGELGQRAAAEEHYRNGQTILKELAQDFPDEPQHRFELSKSHNGLGILLGGLGQFAAAEEQFRECLTIREKLVAEFPDVPSYRQNLAMSYTNFGVLLNDLGEGSGAAEHYLKGLEIREKLAADFPTVTEYRASLALGRLNLANVLAGLGKSAAAEEQYRKSITLLEKLTADFPTVPVYRQHLATSHCNLAVLLAATGQQTAAIELHRKALALREKLVSEFPAVPIYRAEKSDDHNNLGLLLVELGELDQAQEEYRKSQLINEELAAGFPGVPEYQIALGRGHCNFGSLLFARGESEASQEYFGLAIDCLRPVLEQEPRNGVARQFLANSYLGRAQAQDRLRNFTEAANDFEQAIALSAPSEQPLIRFRRVRSLHNAGQAAEAVAEVAELAKLPNWSGLQWYDFARIYSVSSDRIADNQQEYLDLAMELLEKAVDKGFSDAARLKNDTNLDPLRGREDFRELLEELEQSTDKGS